MKKCPNCGTEIAANAKFCTHCGYNLTKATPASATANATSATATQTTTATTQAAVHTSTASANQQQSASAEKQTASRSVAAADTTRTATNQQVQQLQSSAKNYFSWLLASWKNPSCEVRTESYFSYISFVIEALFMTLAAVTISNKFLTTANDSQSYFHISKLAFSTDLKIFLCLLIGMCFYLAVGYVTCLLGSRGTKVGFTTYMKRFGQLTNYAIIVNLLLWFASSLVNFSVDNFFTIAASFRWSIILLSVSVLVWQLGLIFVINKSVTQPLISRVYLALIAVLVVSLLFYFMDKIILQDLQTALLSHATDFANQIGNLFGSQY